MSNSSLLPFIASVCCLFLFSCSDRQYIPISQVHTESAVLTVHDTVFQDRIYTKVIKESVAEKVSQHDSTSVTIDSAGNIKRTDNWHSIVIERDGQSSSEFRDSVSFYRKMYESLLTQRKDSVGKPVFIEKRGSFFYRLKTRLATGIFIVSIIGFAIWRIHRRN